MQHDDEIVIDGKELANVSLLVFCWVLFAGASCGRAVPWSHQMHHKHTYHPSVSAEAVVLVVSTVPT